jgi:fructose-specific component phosphotransferase system IIB-like protein
LAGLSGDAALHVHDRPVALGARRVAEGVGSIQPVAIVQAFLACFGCIARQSTLAHDGASRDELLRVAETVMRGSPFPQSRAAASGSVAVSLGPCRGDRQDGAFSPGPDRPLAVQASAAVSEAAERPGEQPATEPGFGRERAVVTDQRETAAIRVGGYVEVRAVLLGPDGHRHRARHRRLGEARGKTAVFGIIAAARDHDAAATSDVAARTRTVVDLGVLARDDQARIGDSVWVVAVSTATATPASEPNDVRSDLEQLLRGVSNPKIRIHRHRPELAVSIRETMGTIQSAMFKMVHECHAAQVKQGKVR